MSPVTRLKWSAIFFTVFWTGGMLFWSGSFDIPSIVILPICGGLAGYGWYRAMRWQFERMGMLGKEPSTEV